MMKQYCRKVYVSRERDLETVRIVNEWMENV